jgi:hypothetical protein
MGACLSVVVNDLDLLWASVGPPETDPPLVVDSDAVLTRSIALQLLEPVAWRQTKFFERNGRADLTQLPQRRSLYPRIQRTNPFTTPQPLGVLASERPDHAGIV